jgi:hypothetical protein
VPYVIQKLRPKPPTPNWSLDRGERILTLWTEGFRREWEIRPKRWSSEEARIAMHGAHSLLYAITDFVQEAKRIGNPEAIDDEFKQFVECYNNDVFGKYQSLHEKLAATLGLLESAVQPMVA